MSILKISDAAEVLAVSVSKAAESASVSRSTVYEEMRSGRLKFVKVGARRLILFDDLREWLITLRDGQQ